MLRRVKNNVLELFISKYTLIYHIPGIALLIINASKYIDKKHINGVEERSDV